ncbi:putative dolichyl-phosphate beta-D-mannosyltransferase [Violaceomyces palustris]|uniref:Dolichyl-phosphate beta-D-mannosyltransferase n=1 Tax=Violaceomyces palustris TaxID=1673888 RepID=A0ACD0P6B6_9BASI|nr:putative dolichyl-phosphate beta-D-mannosyltransferase [Violaceomyces palustris]
MASRSRKAGESEPEVNSSIIVPAYKENGNITPLVTRLFAALDHHPNLKAEVIIVDDNSRDGSVETVEQLQSQYGYNVRIIVRTTERGLSSAVVRGFQEARGYQMLCMDADLQHPPESVPSLLNAFGNRKEFVLGTRYGEGVSMDKDWPLHRQIISAGARMLARPLTSASDPMSGFFGITKDSFNRAGQINAQGFKIALDLLVKAEIAKDAIAEVPFSFGLRAEGESKLTGKVMIKYLDQLRELYIHKFGLPTILVAIILMFFLAVYLLKSIL